MLRVRLLSRLAGALRDQPSLEPREALAREAVMTAGQVWESRAQLDLITRLVGELGQPPQRWYGGVMATALALQDGRLDEAEQLIEEMLEAGRRSEPWDAEATRLFAHFTLHRERGGLDQLEGDLRRALVTHPGYRSLRCMILSVVCESGRLDEARALFDLLAADDFAGSPRTANGCSP